MNVKKPKRVKTGDANQNFSKSTQKLLNYRTDEFMDNN